MNRVLGLILIGLMALTLSGCPKVYSVEDYKDLNEGLTYLPFEDKSSAQPANPSPSPAGGSAVGPLQAPAQSPGKTSSGNLKLRPHMRLKFLYSPLNESAKNLLISNAFNSYWIIPEAGGPYDGEDFFYFGLLLATGQLDTRENAVEHFNKFVENGLPENLSDKEFYNQLGQRVLSKSFETLELSSIRQQSSGDKNKEPVYTAAWVRQWLNEPSQTDFFDTKQPRQTLLMRAIFVDKSGQETTFNVSTFNWSPGYFNDSATKLAADDLKNKWYQPGELIPRGRGYIKVEIPVLREGDTVSNFYPVWYSVADWEKATGLTVLGIRRSKQYIAGVSVKKGKTTLKLEKCQPDDQKCPANMFTAPDQYFTVWFGSKLPNYGSKAIILANPELKKTLLIGARDVIVAEKRRGETPVDSPGRR